MFVIAVFVTERLITEGTIVGKGAWEMYVLYMFEQIRLLCCCLSTNGTNPFKFSILNSIRGEVCAWKTWFRYDGPMDGSWIYGPSGCSVIEMWPRKIRNCRKMSQESAQTEGG